MLAQDIHLTCLEYVLGVVDTKLEASRTPLDQVERRLGLEGTSGSRAVARHDVTAIEEGNSHVLSVAWITDNHLVVGLET
jgi:hypothetical protein